ncbi:hypothetical protein V6N13_051312 [Hibiscus sabdariffa]
MIGQIGTYHPAVGRTQHIAWCPVCPRQPLKFWRTECRPRLVILITASGLQGEQPQVDGTMCTARATSAVRARHRVSAGKRTGNGSFGGLLQRLIVDSELGRTMGVQLVVGPRGGSAGLPHGEHRSACPFCRRWAPGLNWPGRSSGAVTLKKLECSKQAYACIH